jgi:hypothetical protein
METLLAKGVSQHEIARRTGVDSSTGTTRSSAFVRGLKSRDPERFDVLESLPGEAQVDFGLGAVTLKANGKYRRPYLFVMTLKYSGKSFRVQSLTSFSIT